MARSEPLLRADGVTKEFFGVTALSNVDFELAAGEIHALVGENGAGKSTLIKILTGAYRRDRGKITLEGEPVDPADVKDAQKLGIGTVYQEVNLLPNLTVAENLFLGREPKRFGLTDRGEANRRSRQILDQYGLHIDVTAVLETYSVAVRQIIAIARAVDLSGKVLILDEPTASLDAAEVTRLFAILEDLKARGLGIVFITHFFDQVYRIADRVTILRNGQKVATRPIEGLGRIELVSMMLGRELKEVEDHHAEPVDYSHKPVVASFTGLGKRGRIAPFDLTMHAGEVVGVAGLLGSGRTETAELMFGIAQPDEGRIEVDGKPVCEFELHRENHYLGRVRIQVLQTAKFTETLLLEQVHNSGRWLNNPQMTVRVYHDALMAEVISCYRQRQIAPVNDYPNRFMHHPDEKVQVNGFLADWLDYCLRFGHLPMEHAAWSAGEGCD